MKYFYYFFREIKNTFEFYLIPFAALILPHRVYFLLFKFICKYTSFYRKYAHDSYLAAESVLKHNKKKKTWDCHVKLLYLTDITDFWLAKYRPKKLLKLLKHDGNWMTSQGHLALSIHYGAGYVTLLDLKQHNLTPYFVFSIPQVDFKFQSKVENFYRKARIKHINSISGSMAISTGGGYDKVKTVVKNNGVPIILFDAPQINKKTQYNLYVFGKKYKVASGFVSLICKEKINYQLYNVKLNFDTGTRNIKINTIKSTEDEIELLSELSKYFENIITESPEQWFFWRQSSNLFIHTTS